MTHSLAVTLTLTLALLLAAAPRTTAKVHIRLDHTATAGSAAAEAAAAAAAAAAAEEGGIPLTNDFGLYYTGVVEVGGTTLRVDFDTGSSNMFIFSNGCVGCRDPTAVGSTSYFDPDTSPSFTATGTTLALDYGSGHVLGPLGYDSVSLAGVTVPDVAIVLATAAVGFDAEAEDGLIGLAWPPLSAGGAPTFLQALAAANVLDSLSFSFFLSSSVDVPGELVLGGTNPDSYVGDMTYVPLTAQTYWQVAIAGVRTVWPHQSSSSSVHRQGQGRGRGQGPDEAVAGTAPLLGPGSAILDTGTSLLMGPSSVVGPMIKAVGTVPVNCTHVLWDELPHFTFVLGNNNVQLTLTPRHYILDISGTCQIGLAAQPMGLPIDWTLGDVFLRPWVTHWDVDNARVGFAPVKPI